jgi:hypothetical protein
MPEVSMLEQSSTQSPKSKYRSGIINTYFVQMICLSLISVQHASSLVLSEVKGIHLLRRFEHIDADICNTRHQRAGPIFLPNAHPRKFKSPKVCLRMSEGSDNYEPLPNQPLKGSNPEKEFELNRGLAVDTLLQDYPYLFVKPPDFSIFRKDVVLQDAQGFSVSGLQAYQLFFRIVRQVANTLFSTAQVSVILGDKYATDKSRIRLRWKVELNDRIQYAESERKNLLRKMGFEDGSTADTSSADATFVEGISIYKLDARGMIISHIIQVVEPTMLSPLSAFRSLLPLSNHPSLIPDIGLGHAQHEHPVVTTLRL